MTTRETSFSESDHPGIVFPGNVLSRENDHLGNDFPGNVFPGKKPFGKVTIRETTVNRWDLWPLIPENYRLQIITKNRSISANEMYFKLFATEVMPLSERSLKSLDFCVRQVVAKVFSVQDNNCIAESLRLLSFVTCHIGVYWWNVDDCNLSKSCLLMNNWLICSDWGCADVSKCFFLMTFYLYVFISVSLLYVLVCRSLILCVCVLFFDAVMANKLHRWSFWSWFDVNRPTFDEDMRYKRFSYFVHSDLDF